MKFEINSQNVIDRMFNLLKKVDLPKLTQEDYLSMLQAESLMSQIVRSKKNDK